MSMASQFNPFTQWMKSKDVYVSFDALDIVKQHPNGEELTLGHLEHGEMSWPLFMQILTGLMQYSALETGFTKPLLSPDDFAALAEHLDAQDAHSFVLRGDHLKVRFTAIDQSADAAKQMRHAGTSWMKLWMPYASEQLDAMRDAADEAYESVIEQSMPVFPNDEIDLGEAARHAASWLKFAKNMHVA